MLDHSSNARSVNSRGRIKPGNSPGGSWFISPTFDFENPHLSICRFSPSNHVHKWSTPESIIQGNKNYRLPEAVGIAASHALQQQGAPSRLAMFPDGNHRVLNHGNSLKWHYEVFRWLNQFVGKDNANQKCSD
ncbi:hypothetical protein BDM02DRAFT_3186025 [Thelephora ganbajun]|uniref:Uncharacterized protein n=1 Tax=Thelephora ganbajun TaxID=370292 RepID=A0ACB6ZJN1_THEGA|nr:hypothetical protein BDM02DRAFT_3186025 [Thelephora ganbajun]